MDVMRDSHTALGPDIDLFLDGEGGIEEGPFREVELFVLLHLDNEAATVCMSTIVRSGMSSRSRASRVSLLDLAPRILLNHLSKRMLMYRFTATARFSVIM